MRRHNLWGKKLICAVLCASLILPAAGCAQGGSVDGAGGSGSAAAGTEQPVSGNEGSERPLLSADWDGETAVPGEKEETVYVKADPYGRPKETTVEVILSKITGTDPVEDRSDLRNIKNTEGDEEYESLGEGRYVWENHGEDIRYKGTSDKTLPVDVDVTY